MTIIDTIETRFYLDEKLLKIIPDILYERKDWVIIDGDLYKIDDDTITDTIKGNTLTRKINLIAKWM